jgi:hypothetical protein
VPDGKALKVEFIGRIANMLVLPSPAEAGGMAQHQVAAKEVAGTRNRGKLTLPPVVV